MVTTDFQENRVKRASLGLQDHQVFKDSTGLKGNRGPEETKVNKDWQLDAVKTVRGTAGIRQTLIYVPLTSLSCESRRTVATIAAYSVHTGAIVQTLWWGIVQPQRGTTIIFIDLTENTQCARRTGADVMSHQVNTGASILTWMRLALIEL